MTNPAAEVAREFLNEWCGGHHDMAPEHLAALLTTYAASEREECARVADDYIGPLYLDSPRKMAERIAKAIRSREGKA